MASVKSVTVSLRSGVSEATLPNNVKLVAGKNATISLEDWGKISRTARDTVLTATFNTASYILPYADSTTPSTSDYVLDLTTINNYTTIAGLNADPQAAKKFALGDVVTGFNDAAFKLVLVDAGSAAVTAGSSVIWGGDTTTLALQKAFKAATTVTADVSDVTDDGATPEFAGIAIASITAGRYGWIQIAGLFEAAQVETNVAAGDSLQISKTSDSRLTSVENEVQTLTLSGGAQNDTVKLTFNGHQSSAITFPSGGYANTTAAQVKTALLTISDWSTKTADIAVVKSTNDYIITFTGTLGAQDVGAITVTSATGAGAGSVAETNKGAGGYGGTMGSALTNASSNLSDILIRNNLARVLRSRSTNLFRAMRN